LPKIKNFGPPIRLAPPKFWAGYATVHCCYFSLSIH